MEILITNNLQITQSQIKFLKETSTQNLSPSKKRKKKSSVQFLSQTHIPLKQRTTLPLNSQKILKKKKKET